MLAALLTAPAHRGTHAVAFTSHSVIAAQAGTAGAAATGPHTAPTPTPAYARPAPQSTHDDAAEGTQLSDDADHEKPEAHASDTGAFPLSVSTAVH